MEHPRLLIAMKLQNRSDLQKNDKKTEKLYEKENVFHADLTEKCMKNIFFFFSTGEKCSKLCTENKKRKDVAYETERNEA